MDEQTRQLRDAVLEATEAALEAQLRAVRTLRRAEPAAKPKKEQGRSQVDMAFDILRASAEPLHVSAIIDKIEQRFGVRVDRESLVSALSKRVARRDRFCRVGRNVFGAIRAEEV
jgi:hypothetical protein